MRLRVGKRRADGAAVAAAESAAVSIAAATTAAAVAAAPLFESTGEFATAAEIVSTETIALVAAATSAIPLAPSIETHARPNFRVPTIT